MRRALVGLAAMAAALSATAAEATRWTFGLALPGGTIAGQVRGTLQADGNTVHVSRLDGLTLDGAPLPQVDKLAGSYDVFTRVASGTAIVSRDGSRMGLLACAAASCNEAFYVVTAGTLLADQLSGGSSLFIGSTSFGNMFTIYEPSMWSMAAVPEPASWALLIAGFGLTGAALRRRRLVSVAA